MRYKQHNLQGKIVGVLGEDPYYSEGQSEFVSELMPIYDYLIDANRFNDRLRIGISKWTAPRRYIKAFDRSIKNPSAIRLAKKEGNEIVIFNDLSFKRKVSIKEESAYLLYTILVELTYPSVPELKRWGEIYDPKSVSYRVRQKLERNGGGSLLDRLTIYLVRTYNEAKNFAGIQKIINKHPVENPLIICSEESFDKVCNSLEKMVKTQ